jgi:hypothetical protein
MTPSMADNPKNRAAKDLDDTIARFKSTSYRRNALRKALARLPDDERLKNELKRLSGPQFIQRAAKEGVYMSYSRADEVFTLELHDYLTEAGIDVWLDMIDAPDDRDWDSEVIAAQTSSGLMVAILSPEALADEALQAERSQFNQSGKLILPVLHRYCECQNPQSWLPVIDCANDLERGLQSLLRILQGKSLAV